MKLAKLMFEINKNVFVVSESRYGAKHSNYGKLEEVNVCNIIITKKPFGDTVIPIENVSERIMKIYNSNGSVVYSCPKKKEWQALGTYSISE